MKTLILVACAFVIAGADPCQFDPQEACNKCPFDRNWVQYVADGCDCNIFYICEKRDGVITYHAQRCDPCHCFSNEDWSCSNHTRDLPECTDTYAPIVPIPTVPDKPDFWCVDFDNDWREAPVYYDKQQYCQRPYVGTFWDVLDYLHRGLHTSGYGLFTNGYPCNIEVPYFQNNQFRQFTFCGMFMWFDWYGSIEMGLAYNGYAWECSPGSIRVQKTTRNTISASVTTQYGGTTPIENPRQVAPWVWHDFCLRFDGSARTLDLSVDGVSATRKTGPKLSGLTAAKKCNMRFGEVLEPFSGGYYIYSFKGLLDSFCFTPAIVPESHFH